MENVERRFVLALQQAAGALRMDMERRVKWSGLSHIEWLTLDAIVVSEGAAPQSDLTRQLGERYATAAQMIRRLVAAGLITQTASGEDRRAKLVSITASGLALHREVKTEVERMHRDVLSAVGRSEISTAIKMLDYVRSIADGSKMRNSNALSVDTSIKVKRRGRTEWLCK